MRAELLKRPDASSDMEELHQEAPSINVFRCARAAARFRVTARKRFALHD